MLRNVSEMMGARPWWVLLEKKHWRKMGKDVHSNIKFQFQLVDSTTGLKLGRGVSHHLNWQAINRHASQMFLP